MGETVWVLGLNNPPGGMHHPTACLVDDDGRVVGLGEEERFTRTKYGVYEQPHHAIRFLLERADIGADDIDVVAVGWDFAALPERQTAVPPVNEYLFDTLGPVGWTGSRRPEVVFVPHHLAHATSTFYASGFDRSAVLVIDGAGEVESASVFTAGRTEGVRLERSWSRAHSMGDMFSAASTALGFGFLDAGKTMGLAAYGEARGLEPWPLVAVGRDDFAPLHLEAAAEASDHSRLIQGWHKAFRMAAGRPIKIRRTDAPTLETNDVAVQLAWSVQHALEEVIGCLSAYARRLAGIDNLCLAGGVSLNCSANGKIAEPVFAVPVANDAGVALGAAWHVCPPVTPFGEGNPFSPYLGESVALRTVADALHGYVIAPLDTDDVADRLLRGEIGSIATGRAEIGPRALCHRSILAAPFLRATRTRVNTLKGREQWRPLSPAVLRSAAPNLCGVRPHLMRFMLGAAEIAPGSRNDLAAVVHENGTARPQLIDPQDNPVVAGVLERMAALGYPPVVMNTSFNGPGEPIVNTAAHALAAFDRLGLDFLILEDRLVTR